MEQGRKWQTVSGSTIYSSSLYGGGCYEASTFGQMSLLTLVQSVACLYSMSVQQMA